MIDFYTWATPNGTKVAIMLEETGLPYRLRPVNLAAKEQKTPGFLALNPNGKIPAIHDPVARDGQPMTIWESAAILEYLSRKSGMFHPERGRQWHTTNQWIMFQMSGIGPMFGQVHHFRDRTPPVPEAYDRFHAESLRLIGVLDERLGQSAYLAGPDYGLADIATWPWLRSWQTTIGQDLDAPNVARWHADVLDRPAVQKAVAIYDDIKARQPHGAFAG